MWSQQIQQPRIEKGLSSDYMSASTDQNKWCNSRGQLSQLPNFECQAFDAGIYEDLTKYLYIGACQGQLQGSFKMVVRHESTKTCSGLCRPSQTDPVTACWWTVDTVDEFSVAWTSHWSSNVVSNFTEGRSATSDLRLEVCLVRFAKSWPW